MISHLGDRDRDRERDLDLDRLRSLSRSRSFSFSFSRGRPLSSRTWALLPTPLPVLLGFRSSSDRDCDSRRLS